MTGLRMGRWRLRDWRHRAGLKPPRSQNEAGWKPAETGPRRVDEGNRCPTGGCSII
jgi:hypothetical protein